MPSVHGAAVPNSSERQGADIDFVAAERTGTNLLIGMLKDFTDCYAGGELFNAVNIKNDIIPWRDLEDANEADLSHFASPTPSLFGTRCSRRASNGAFRLSDSS